MKEFVAKLYPGFPGGRIGLGLLALRIVMGIAFMKHGFGKIQHPFGWMGEDSHVPPIIQACAALSEFGGGLAWLLGLLTPLASFGIACTMAVATYFHVSGGGSFGGRENSYEPALVYLIIAILFLLAGPGRYSLDRFLFGRAGNDRA